MRLRRSKNEPEADPSTPPTDGQPSASGATGNAPGATPATSGPGPVRGQDPDQSPRPPITGAHPVARTPAPAEADGLRAWLASLDRKLGTRTYAGAAAIVLAMAAAIVAIVLAIDARDNSAGNEDLTRVEAELTSLLAEESANGETALDEVDELSSRLSTLEDQVADLIAGTDGSEQRLTVVEDDIDDLRQQISDLSTAADRAAASAGNDAP